MSVYTVRAHRYQIEALSSFVGSSPNAPYAVRQLAGAFNALLASPPAPPPPDPSDPLARMRAASSQLAIWRLVTPTETIAMNAIHGVTRVAQQLGFYGPGLPGNVACRQVGPASYEFVRSIDGAEQWVPDVGGASDALVAQNAGGPDKVIGALSP